MEHYLLIRGKRLYVDVRGPQDAPALLYLHGGPGQGAYEFMAHQGDRLSESLRVIGLDQRGVLRSDPLSDDEPLGLQDLIDDCEAVRQELRIERWSVLGQSFGGYVALLYAVTYPEAVETLLFENPAWDLGLTSKNLLRGAALLYRESGESEAADACLEVVEHTHDTVKIWESFTRLTNGLQERRARLYMHKPETGARIQQVVGAAPFPGEYWSRGFTHQQRLYKEGRLWESLIPLFPRIPCPTLLIKGKHDYIPSPEEVRAFVDTAPSARVELFEESAHFVQVEEPERYAATVTQFILGNR